MNTFHSFNNHSGLAAVMAWDKVLHSNRGKRSKHLLAAALAIVNGTQLPPPPLEGKTNRPWRSWETRLATIEQILQNS